MWSDYYMKHSKKKIKNCSSVHIEYGLELWPVLIRYSTMCWWSLEYRDIDSVSLTAITLGCQCSLHPPPVLVRICAALLLLCYSCCMFVFEKNVLWIKITGIFHRQKMQFSCRRKWIGVVFAVLHFSSASLPFVYGVCWLTIKSHLKTAVYLLYWHDNGVSWLSSLFTKIRSGCLLWL